MTICGPGPGSAAVLLLLSISGPAGSSPLYTVPLGKQHVPVEVNGKIVAHKTAYFGTVHVGYPEPQNFTVVFDTGSAHFFIPSASCENEPCLMHKRYNRSASTSAIDIDHDGAAVDVSQERDQVAIAYGTGEVLGEFVSEVVCVGSPAVSTDASGQSNCARVRVVLAQEMTTEPFRAFTFDGVLGLGLEALALAPEFNFFGQMAKAAEIEPVFSVFLAQTDDEQSEISFGGHNERRLSRPMQWVPVLSPEMGYWQVKLNSVSIGGKALALCSAGDCTAILDTGTSMLGVPKQHVKTFHMQLARKVPGERADADCRAETGPLLSLDVGGFEVYLAAEDYSRPTTMRFESKTGGQNVPHVICPAALLPVEMAFLGPKVFILGEPVLRKYYTAYHLLKQQVGFAPVLQKGAPVVV